MASRIIDLTFPIHEGMQTFPVPWHPVVGIKQLGSIDREGRQTCEITLGTHTGTHMDAPRHFIGGGQTVDLVPLEQLVGPAVVCDFTHALPFQMLGVGDLEAAIGDEIPERIMLRFDWSDHFGTPAYYTDHAFLSEAAAHWLVDRGCRLVAMDTPMPDNPKNGKGSSNDSPVHKILLSQGVVLVEYLTKLRDLTQRQVQLVVAPLPIKNGDGAPVRCFAIEQV